MGRVGVEPTLSQSWGIYSPLPSPLGIPAHIKGFLGTYYYGSLKLITAKEKSQQSLRMDIQLTPILSVALEFINLFFGGIITHKL